MNVRRQRSWFKVASIVGLSLAGMMLAYLMIFPPLAFEPYIDLADDRSVASGLGSLLILLVAISFARIAVGQLRGVGASSTTPAALGWVFLSVAFLFLSLVDLFSLRVRQAFEIVIGIGIAVVLLLLVSKQRSRRGRVWWLFVLAIALLATNPATDYVERRLISDPTNYTFVAANQPYAFNGDAAHRLDVVRRVQEGSEAVAMLCLIAGCWFYLRPTIDPGVLSKPISSG